MGAWGVRAFDNDDAADWGFGLESVSDLSLVEQAFATVEEADDYLEAPPASEALAACEALARQLGRPGYQDPYTKKVDEWAAQNPLRPTQALLDRAKRVIDRILAEKSELRDLWDEGDASEWLAAINDLRSRLRV